MVHEYDAHVCDVCKIQVIVKHGEANNLMRPFSKPFEKMIDGLPEHDRYTSDGIAEICSDCINDIVKYVESRMVRPR